MLALAFLIVRTQVKGFHEESRMTRVFFLTKDRNVLASLSVLIAGLILPTSASAEQCRFLMPIGGNGNGPAPHIVKKQVQRPKGLIGNAIGRTNWNTDFVVDQSSKRFKLFFTADSTEGTPGAYPIEAYLKFTDGSNLQVVNQSMKPPTGTGAQFGPFSPPVDKAVSQVNFKIGANKDPGGTGFSYRISVQGCN